MVALSHWAHMSFSLSFSFLCLDDDGRVHAGLAHRGGMVTAIFQGAAALLAGHNQIASASRRRWPSLRKTNFSFLQTRVRVGGWRSRGRRRGARGRLRRGKEAEGAAPPGEVGTVGRTNNHRRRSA
jgi:hypothetical protein